MDSLFSQSHYNCQVRIILHGDEKAERIFVMHSQHSLYRIDKVMRLVFGLGAIKGNYSYLSALNLWEIKIHDLVADAFQALCWSSDDDKYHVLIGISETEHERKVKKPICTGASGDLPIKLTENYAAMCNQAGIKLSGTVEMITALLKWEKKVSDKRRKDYQDNYL